MHYTGATAWYRRSERLRRRHISSSNIFEPCHRLCAGGQAPHTRPYQAGGYLACRLSRAPWSCFVTYCTWTFSSPTSPHIFYSPYRAASGISDKLRSSGSFRIQYCRCHGRRECLHTKAQTSDLQRMQTARSYKYAPAETSFDIQKLTTQNLERSLICPGRTVSAITQGATAQWETENGGQGSSSGQASFRYVSSTKCQECAMLTRTPGYSNTSVCCCSIYTASAHT